MKWICKAIISIAILMAMVMSVTACDYCPGDASPITKKSGDSVTFTAPAGSSYSWTVEDATNNKMNVQMYSNGVPATNGLQTFTFDVPPSCSQVDYGVYVTVGGTGCQITRCRHLIDTGVCCLPADMKVCATPGMQTQVCYPDTCNLGSMTLGWKVYDPAGALLTSGFTANPPRCITLNWDTLTADGTYTVKYTVSSPYLGTTVLNCNNDCSWMFIAKTTLPSGEITVQS
jgi:hypothetical protein